MFTKPLRGAMLNYSHPLARGLVGCWLFNEGCGNKAYDLSGYGNHGTLEGMAFPPTAASGWNPGRTGPALAFDGSSDYVNCGNSSHTDAITIEALVKADVGSSGHRGIVCKSLDDPRVFGISIDDLDQLRMYIVADSTYHGSTDDTISEGVWTHLVGSYISGDMRLYINGNLSKSHSDCIGLISTTSDDLIIGKININVHRFDGTIDRVRIYDRALSAEEIKWLYHEPYAMFEPATEIGMLCAARLTPSVGSNVAAAELLR